MKSIGFVTVETVYCPPFRWTTSVEASRHVITALHAKFSACRVVFNWAGQY